MENRNLYRAIGIAMFIGVIVYVIYSRRHDSGWDKMIKVIEKDEYFGKVEKKFIDKQNHNTPTLILSSQRKVTLYGQQWDLIEVGDSLSKKINSVQIEVSKKDTTLYINQKEYIKNLQKRK